MKLSKQTLSNLQKQGKIPKTDHTGMKFIKKVLTENNIAFEPEHRFHKVRRFKFDLAIIDRKIGIEYEGIKGKSRHTTMTGYTGDCTKYNLAQSEGWRIMRYTVLNYKDFENDLKLIINN